MSNFYNPVGGRPVAVEEKSVTKAAKLSRSAPTDLAGIATTKYGHCMGESVESMSYTYSTGTTRCEDFMKIPGKRMLDVKTDQPYVMETIDIKGRTINKHKNYTLLKSGL